MAGGGGNSRQFLLGVGTGMLALLMLYLTVGPGVGGAQPRGPAVPTTARSSHTPTPAPPTPSPAPVLAQPAHFGIHKRTAVIQRVLFTDPKCQRKTGYVEHMRDAVVVEVGSYKGEELVQFRGRVKKVVTYEPNPRKITEIDATVKVEGMTAVVQVRNAAVTNVSGPITLYLPNGAESQQDGMGKVNFATTPLEEMVVDGVTLSDEIQEHVHFLKVDTQGHEFQVLQGATELIRKHGIDMLHLEFSPNLMRMNGADPVEMLQWLHDAGYVCFYCTERFMANGKLPEWEKDASWDFAAFTQGFGPFLYGNGAVDHGMWGDLLCL